MVAWDYLFPIILRILMAYEEKIFSWKTFTKNWENRIVDVFKHDSA